MTGYLTKPKTREHYEKDGRNLYNFHNSPLTITLLNLMFEINDLKIAEILNDKKKKKQFLLYPFVLLLRIIAAVTSKKKREKHQTDLSLKPEVIMGGNTLIFIVEKQ
jgi:hypothetical protein